jgi:tetratricopeptide (TPR) repeat protein
MEQLIRAQQLAGRGRGQIVAIIGEPGMGKSRLIHEFAHSHHTAEWLVLESNATAFGPATPYLPTIELLRHYFTISRHDTTESIHQKVTDKISALDPSLHETIPPLLDLLDALDSEHPFRSLDPIQHRHSTYQAVARLLLSQNNIQPVVAVVENLHWNDALTIGLLNELVIASQKARFLLIVSYRPDYDDEWRNRPNYHRLRLDPLAGESLSDLLQFLLGSHPGLSALNSFLIERASGNPFFVEEIVRTLVDTGVLDGQRGSYRLVRPFSSIGVPPTVQAVLGARIDRLPFLEKRLLQEAAVIGYDVPFSLLQAISGLADEKLLGLLDHLQAVEFLYPTRLFPDLQYTFKHALTQDATYRGVLRERRREIHARVVYAIEQRYGDRLSEEIDLLAHHAVRGELHEKAVYYLRQAGAKAGSRSALVDARGWFEQALDVLKALPETQDTLEQAFEIRLELRSVLRQLGEVRQMLEHLREAETIAEQLKDEPRRGQICGLLTTVLSTLDELDEAVLIGTRAIEIAERTSDLRLSVVATSCIEEAHYYRAEYQHVAEIAARSLRTLPSEWLHEFLGLAVPPSVFGRAWLTMSLTELGRFAEASRCAEEVIQIAEPTQHAHTIGWAHLAASMLYLLKGDWAHAHRRVEQWIAVLRTGSATIQLPWAVGASAWALAQIGAQGEASDRVQEGERLLESQTSEGIVGHRSWACHAVGRACLLLGRLDDARRLGDRSVQSANRQPGFAAHGLHLLGDIAIHPDRFDAAIGDVRYREALALAERHRMRPLIAQCHLGLGKLYRMTGKTERARDHLGIATIMYREMDMGFWLHQAVET